MEVIATHHGNVGMLRSMRSSAFDAYIGPPHIAVDGQHAGENLILLKQVPELGIRVHAALSGPVADSDAVILRVRQHHQALWLFCRNNAFRPPLRLTP